MDQPTRQLIESMSEQLQQQDALLKRLAEGVLLTAHVLHIEQDFISLLAAGGVVEAKKPDFKISVGDAVVINEKQQIVRKANQFAAFGALVTVSRVLNEQSCEVGGDGQTKIVLSGQFSPKPGDLVALDRTGYLIIDLIPADDKQKVTQSTVTPIHWDDIGGQEAAKAALQEAVVLPQLHPEIFASYGKKVPAGILLHGSPGNGKTLLGRAVATALQNGQAGGFFPVKGPEVLDVYVGESERKIRSLFKAARQHKAETGKPAVIFIDEAEALLSKRGGRGLISGMEKTIVPTFLAETDGLEASAAIVILATNKPDMLDEAVVREGRMDRKIEVARPGVVEAEAILAIHLRGLPLSEGVTIDGLAKHVTAEIFTNHDHLNGSHKTLKDIVSGAMLAGLAEQAKSVALMRDLSAKAKQPSGIAVADMQAALARVKAENRHISHM
jgi:proteasome-associated ATPase